jgi:hypothetical protein
MHPQSLKKIFPVYTQLGEQPVTILKAIDAAVFGYPFFNQGVQERSRLNEDKRVYGWDELQMDEEKDLLQLKGFIFHTSHCGSTLLSRMLGSLPGVRVVSETEAINGLLLSLALNSLPQQVVLVQLKQIIEAYRQPLAGEKMLLFKLTSWNIFFIKLFQQLYPDMPWIYLDRDTNAVVNSLLHEGRGFADWWDLPVDILRSYFTGREKEFNSKEDYLRQMVEMHRMNAQSNQNKKSCLLQYPDWIGQFERVILPHFDLHFSKDEAGSAFEVSRYQSKQFEKTLFNPPVKEQR